MEKRNEILDLSFEFALQIIDYSESLESEKKFVIARQLLKSGTFIGANIREAQNSESSLDFIHKLKIAFKEAEETEFWLLLCEKSKHYPTPYQDLLNNLISIKKLLNRIITTSKNNLKKNV